ncbi:Aste57867_10791 [Aphanomyces stellatus]|uniref:Aste57867_10791 protein n=1 Tax=Aphanomyces stellatus TaxID=120398 RepID=A0A485KSX4_9STRA|nr:hypothetical protein As57867_010751 [Aphanomyces stellatus]VFT87660.1 Aste57867_10791 [Aphanomyces stellatus]
MGRQLKGMAKAKRVFTVDDDEFDDGTTAAMPPSDVEASDDDDDDHFAAPTGPSSLRIRASKFDDSDPMYKGKVVKRADLRDKEDDEEEDDEEELERQMAEEWSEGEQFAPSDEEDSDDAPLEVEEEVDDDEEENDDEEDDDEHVGRAGGDAPLEDEAEVDDMIRSLEEEDEAMLMRASDDNQQQRAKHVYHQKLIYERCLELQISIKQILTSVNTLASETPSAQKDALVATVRASMATLGAMQQELYSQPEFTSSTTSKKRSFDDVTTSWASIDDESTAALAVYQPILNKHSVQADTQGKKFKAVNQDILIQVDGVLADSQRIRRKAHPVKPVESDGGETDDEQLDDLVYDDKEFYHQLLKEYIESGTAGEAASGAAAQLKLKRKVKKVNRKASKGRVIKYTAMPKLQHFMFPNPSAVRTDMDVDELFRSLFTSSASSS